MTFYKIVKYCGSGLKWSVSASLLNQSQLDKIKPDSVIPISEREYKSLSRKFRSCDEYCKEGAN